MQKESEEIKPTRTAYLRYAHDYLECGCPLNDVIMIGHPYWKLFWTHWRSLSYGEVFLASQECADRYGEKVGAGIVIEPEEEYTIPEGVDPNLTIFDISATEVYRGQLEDQDREMLLIYFAPCPEYPEGREWQVDVENEIERYIEPQAGEHPYFQQGVPFCSNGIGTRNLIQFATPLMKQLMHQFFLAGTRVKAIDVYAGSFGPSHVLRNDVFYIRSEENVSELRERRRRHSGPRIESLDPLGDVVYYNSKEASPNFCRKCGARLHYKVYFDKSSVITTCNICN